MVEEETKKQNNNSNNIIVQEIKETNQSHKQNNNIEESNNNIPKNTNIKGQKKHNQNNNNKNNTNINHNSSNNTKKNNTNKNINLNKEEKIKNSISTTNEKLEAKETSDKKKIIEKTNEKSDKSEKNIPDTQNKSKEESQQTLNQALNNININKEKASLKNEISEQEKEKIEKATIPNNSGEKKPIGKIILIVIIVLLILLISIFSIFTYLNNNHSLIAKNVYINGINVSQMTKDEAKKKIEEYYLEKLSHDISLTHGEYEAFIKPSEISLQYDINSAINNAFSIGKKGNIFEDDLEILKTILNGVSVTPAYTYNTDSLKTILDNFSKELPDHVIENNYYIEDNNLIITLGTAGKAININNTMNQIESSIKDLTFTDKKIEIDTITKEPEKLDISKIHSEIKKDPKDAYYTTDPYVVYPSENGIDFEISEEEATNLVSNSTEKEIQIPLKTLYPNVTTNMIGSEAFPDLLATFSTKYVNNKDRTTNLSLAAKKINGYVLLPGETFSYNTVVGERTIAAGYKSAAIYQNGEVVQGLGGGICQISTTLFNAALLANLEIVELHNHQFVPSYVTAGRDATVVYGVKDFKFKNTRKYAIKIECTVSNGVAKFNIWGVKEPVEYDVSISASVTSRTSSYIKSVTYRTLKLNGEVVKSEKISNYTYKVH